MQGLLDFIKTPEGQGLLSGVFGYAANARRGTPINNLGRGGIAGLLGYSNALEREQDAKQNEWLQQYRGLQMDQMRSEIEKNRQAEAERQRIDGLVRGAIGGFTPQQAIGMDASGPTQAKANMIGQPGQVDYRALYAQGVPMAKIQELVDLGNVNKTKVKNIETINIDGKPVKVGIDEYGQQVAQIGTEWRQMEKLDRGGSIDYLDPYNLSPVASFKRTMTPGEAASNAVARGNLFMRQREFENRPERTVTVMDSSGNAIELPESKAGNMPKYSPQAAAQLRKEAESKKARTQMTTALNELKSYYDTLKEGGGIVSQQQGPIENIWARASSSIPGQTVSGAVGTRNQMTRDKIEQTRPLLLNLIKEATGMSAQQMNSNAEMQMYLRAATDPTLSYEANVQALQNLDKLFGLGLGFGSGGNDVLTEADRIIGGK